MHIYICTYIYIYIYVFIHLFMCVWRLVLSLFLYIYTCTYIYIYMYIDTRHRVYVRLECSSIVRLDYRVDAIPAVGFLWIPKEVDSLNASTRSQPMTFQLPDGTPLSLLSFFRV